MSWWRLGLSAGAALASAGAAAAGLGRARWRRRTRLLHDALDAAREAPVPARFDPAELSDLPAPVRRFLSQVLVPGQALIAAADIAQRGRFNLSETSDQWRPFRARQRIITRRPGFAWDADIRLLPGLSVRVHDAYAAGEGSLYAALLGIAPLVDQRGGEALSRGELMRILAEAPWYPTFLLPSQGVHWRALDDSSALATLDDDGVSIALTFRFGSDGLVASVHADDRPRLVGGLPVPTPWEGRWWDYARRDGLLVPSRGEVSWIIDGRSHPYWRGTLDAVRYQYAAGDEDARR